MECTPIAENQHRFSQAIDLLASEYGWTVDEILSLTISQLNILVSRINERLSQGAVVQASLMRLAICGSLTKEGAADFKKFVKEAQASVQEDMPQQKAATPEMLAKFGLGGK